MRHILGSCLALHWAAVFALLALICVVEGNGAPVAALRMLAVAVSPHDLSGPGLALLSALLAVGFSVVAILFIWCFVTTFSGSETVEGDAEDIVRMAFAGAVAMMSLLLVGGTTMGIGGLFPIVAMQLGALAASHLAILAEGWSTSLATTPDNDDIRAAARIMALSAAHSSMLSRISGRTETSLKEGL